MKKGERAEYSPLSPRAGFSFTSLVTVNYDIYEVFLETCLFTTLMPLNHAFHFIHQMLMVLQTPTSPIQGSHSGLRSSESQAGNCWELLGSAHSGAVGHPHVLFVLGAMLRHLWNIGSPAMDRAQSFALELRVLTTRLPGKSPSPLSLGGVVSLERIGCEYLRERLGETVEAGGQG